MDKVQELSRWKAEAIENVRLANERVRLANEQARQAREAWRECAVSAHSLGVPVSEIARAMGLSRQRTHVLVSGKP
jgi:hypothetical protein